MKKARRKLEIKKYPQDKWFDWSKATTGWYAHMTYGPGPRAIDYDEVWRLPLGNGQIVIKNKHTGYVNIVGDPRYVYGSKIAALKALLKDQVRYLKDSRKQYLRCLDEFNKVRKELAKEERRYRDA